MQKKMRSLYCTEYPDMNPLVGYILVSSIHQHISFLLRYARGEATGKKGVEGRKEPVAYFLRLFLVPVLPNQLEKYMY